MTPAEHYAEAERLLGQIDKVTTRRSDGSELPWEPVASTISTLVARAQVHATLATVTDRNFRRTKPLGELTEREIRVLRDAVSDVMRSRPAGSVRSKLLDSASEKIGLWDANLSVRPTDIDTDKDPTHV